MWRVISVHSKQKQKEEIKKATKSGKLFEIELYWGETSHMGEDTGP